MPECVICGGQFELPPRSKRRTCSGTCQSKLGASSVQQSLLPEEAPKPAARGGRWANPHARGVKGYREDLGGIYMRSRWEANVARFLDVLVMNGEILGWEYEPRKFEFPIKRGHKTYTPDFLIHEIDGSHYWLEVKGWMDKPSQIKIKRFGIHFPKERLVIVDDKTYREMEKQFKDEIPNWELKPT